MSTSRSHPQATIPEMADTYLLMTIVCLGTHLKVQTQSRAIPSEKYGGVMDFLCLLSNGDYALVEMQVIPQD